MRVRPFPEKPVTPFGRVVKLLFLENESGHFWSNRISLSAGASIPKGLCLSAQSCEERATLGRSRPSSINPEGVAALPSLRINSGCNPVGVDRRGTFSQGSSFLATLGFGAESLWVSGFFGRSFRR